MGDDSMDERITRTVQLDATRCVAEAHEAPQEMLTVDDARAKVAATISCAPEEVYFVSDGMPAAVVALRAAYKGSGVVSPHIVTTTIEAEANRAQCALFEQKDTTVTYLSPISTGRVEVAMIENALRPETRLISITAANPETGTSEPFSGIGALASQRDIPFHLDASYAFGRMPIDVNRSHIDLLSADADLFGGPAGTGFLYVRHGRGIETYVEETLPDDEVLTRLAHTAESAARGAARFMEQVRPVRDHLRQRIFDEIADVTLCGHRDHCLASHLEVRIAGVSAAVLQQGMAEAGFSIGIGDRSPVLRALGKPESMASEVVRFSLTAQTTREDVDQAVDALKDLVEGQRIVG